MKDFDSPELNDRYTHQKRYFEAVVSCYTEIRESHPLAACNYDPEAETRNHPLCASSVEHAVDIERATEFALKDHPELESVWFQLAANDPAVNGLSAMKVVRLCSKVYKQRQLEPWSYRRRVRR